MSLVELRTIPELTAHYKAVQARLLAGPTFQTPALPPSIPVPPPPEPEPPINVEDVAARWRDIDERVFGRRVSAKAVIDVTAAYFGISVDAVCGKCRSANIAKARQTAIYLMRELCRQFCSMGDTVEIVKFSFVQTASYFSIDHSTAIHAIERAQRRMAEDEKYATAISEIMTLLQRGEKK